MPAAGVCVDPASLFAEAAADPPPTATPTLRLITAPPVLGTLVQVR